MDRIRVIVIDDSAFMRKVISDILESDTRIEVVSTARNGLEGLKQIEKYAPDVVTMDVHMPVMDGIQALETIMETGPLPVIILSGVSEEGKIKTIEAISKGAIDFITKPSGQISLDLESIKEEIITKVITATKSKLQGRDIRKVESKIEVCEPNKAIFDRSIVLIGTSTGGPRALHRIIRDLPDDFSSPICIVQHLPEGFTKSLAERLNSISRLYVKEAKDGESLKQNTVYIAPGNHHMRIVKSSTNLQIQLNTEKTRNGHRPSVDELFESAAPLQDINKIAVILTGMGQEGSEGIKHLKKINKNTVVIAEAEETAVVYGMPKAAIKTNCVDYIVPLDQIAERLKYLNNHLTVQENGW